MKLSNDCRRCPLHRRRRKIVWGEGNRKSRVMGIAEGPGYYEDCAGIPMVGATGKEHDVLLEKWAGMSREDTYTTNTVKCRPPNNRNPTEAEIGACSRWLNIELEAIGPTVIMAIGGVSTRNLLGPGMRMDVVNGLPHWSDKVGAVVVPMFHPAYALHETSAMWVVERGYKALGDYLDGRLKVHRPVEADWGHELLTRPAQVRSIAEGKERIAVDTEWARGELWCASFAVEDSRTPYVVMGEDGATMGELARILAQEGTTTIMHNALYDLGTLATVGVHPARVEDTMVMAYLLQDEPRGLKALAYRHLGRVMSSYREMVKEADWANGAEYLERAVAMDWGKPKPELVWDKVTGEPRVKQPMATGTKLRRALMDVLTKGADPQARWKNAKWRGEVEQVLGEMPPGELCDIDLEEALDYAGTDAAATLELYPILKGKVQDRGMGGVFDVDMGCMPIVWDMMRGGVLVDKAYFRGLSAEFKAGVERLVDEIEEATGRRINPVSSVQVSALLYDKEKDGGLGLSKSKYGRIAKIKSKTLTDDKVLSRIAQDDPVAKLVQGARALDKLRSSYAITMPQLAAEDGRVHTTISLTRVTTGRLASSNPNLMAIPIRTKEGRRIRDGFIAQDGCSLLSMDYSQVEMRVAASDAGDKRMMRIFNEGLDIHSQTASAMFGVKEEDLDEMKHRYPAKRVGFGILNDISPGGLLREMVAGGARAEDWSLEQCEELVRSWFKLYSGIAAYMKRNRAQARRHGYVVDMWGRWRIVAGARANSSWVREDAMRKAGNAPIQMGAQGIIKRAMVKVWELVREYREAGAVVNPIIQIHDDIVTEVEDRVLEEYYNRAKAIMEGAGEGKVKVPILVDGKVGKRWGNMDKWGGGKG